MRKEYAGNAVRATLGADIDSTVLNFQTNVANGWPVGTYPFVALITDGTNEEKLLCDARTGVTFSVLERGYDGTAARAWTTGASVLHVLDAVSVEEFNEHADATGVYYQATGVDAEFRKLYVLGEGGEVPAGLQNGDVVVQQYGSNPADDTGWIDAELKNGWTNASGNEARYRIINGIVFLNGRVNAPSASVSGSTVFTLPVGFRPSKSVGFAVGAVGTDAKYESRVVLITTSGDFILYSHGLLSNILINESFPADG